MDDDHMGDGFPADYAEVPKSPLRGDSNRAHVFVLWEPEGGSGFHPRRVPLDERKKKIGRSQPKVWIRDVGSANGTTVNGVRLAGLGEESGPLEVQTGDVVRLGEDMLDQNGDVTYKCIRARLTLCDPATGNVLANTRLTEVDVHALYVPEVTHHGRHADRNTHLQRELDGMVVENRRLREAMTKAAEQRLARDQAQLQGSIGTEADESRQKELYRLYESIKHNGLEADGLAIQMMELTEILAAMEDRAQGDVKGLMGAAKLYPRKQKSAHAPSLTPKDVGGAGGSGGVSDVDRQLLVAAEERVADLRKNVEALEAAVGAEAAQAKDIDMELQLSTGERQGLEQRVCEVREQLHVGAREGAQAQDLARRLAMLEEEANSVQRAVASAKELLDRLQNEAATQSPASITSSQSAAQAPATPPANSRVTIPDANINQENPAMATPAKPGATLSTIAPPASPLPHAQDAETVGKATPPAPTATTGSLESTPPKSDQPLSTSPQGKSKPAESPQRIPTEEKLAHSSQTATPSPLSANLHQQQNTETPPPASAPNSTPMQNKPPLFSSLDNSPRNKKEDEENEEREEARDTMGKGGPSTSPPALGPRSGDQSPLPTTQDDGAASKGGSLGKAASAALLRKSQSAKSPGKNKSIKKSPSSRSAQDPAPRASTDRQPLSQVLEGHGSKPALHRKGSEHKKGMCAVM